MDFSFFKNLFAANAKPASQDETADKTAETSPEVPENAEQHDKCCCGDCVEDVKTVRRPKRQHGRNGRRREQSDEAQENMPELSSEEAQEVLAKLESFVQFTAKSLVDEPDKVITRIVEKDGANVILVACAKKDTGKVIGKSGKIIAAIRILVSGSASRVGLRATVDIDE